jgi:hypothetical protein
MVVGKVDICTLCVRLGVPWDRQLDLRGETVASVPTLNDTLDSTEPTVTNDKLPC